MNIYEESLKLHEENKGKIEVISKTEVKDMHDLAVVYTPELPNPVERSIKMLMMSTNILPKETW